MVMGLYRILEDNKIKIPDDIAEAAMDSTELSSVIISKLSTVAIAVSEIGEKAGNLIFKRLDGNEI